MSTKHLLRQIWQDQRGSVTAEFALALPAILLVFALLLAGIAAGSGLLTSTAAAAELARLEARGDSVQAANYRNQLAPRHTVEQYRQGELLCITVHSNGGAGLGQLFPVSATSCAWQPPQNF